MTKYCFNYDTGEYEYIDKNGYSYDQGEYVYNWDDSEYKREEEEEKEKPKRKKIAASVKMRNINRAPDTRLLH